MESQPREIQRYVTSEGKVPFDEKGEYQKAEFKGTDRIISPTFSELSLTAEQVLTA